jgi:glucuronokinase
VIQVFEGLVYMDFARESMRCVGGLPRGVYERLDPALLPPLYLAFCADVSEPTEVMHNDLRSRYNRGEPAVVEAMKFWANLAEQVKECLLKHEWKKIGPLLDSNFDKRREIYQISAGNIRMVETARSLGASAKFSGSGGAIVGTYPDEAAYQKLAETFAAIGVKIFKPIIHPEPRQAHL